MLLFPPVGVQRDEAADREERAAFDPCAWFIQPTEHKHVDNGQVLVTVMEGVNSCLP